ncbi:hypothetical protein EfmJHP10_24580 [Enterococcus faecium]|nr:hypothetical protein EfmJHP10_24580 [Enterococcus faecium]
MIATDGATVSKSFVSNLMKQLDPFVFEWRNRSLEGSEYPFFMCDALYMKVRENHRIVSKGVYIGIGIDSDGRRTILGFDVQDGESEDNWDTVFQSYIYRVFILPSENTVSFFAVTGCLFSEKANIAKIETSIWNLSFSLLCS